MFIDSMIIRMDNSGRSAICVFVNFSKTLLGTSIYDIKSVFFRHLMMWMAFLIIGVIYEDNKFKPNF